MLAVATEEARRMGADELIAEYRPTEKNAPCLEFWEQSGFENSQSKHVFRWTLEGSYPVPDHIDLVLK
jgi:predicted enzyme involved in methoxymalonyl-ACP biosynthesis